MVSAVHLWDGPLRDLSAWRVMVPEVLVKAEPENPNRCYYTYLVDVRRVDVIEGETSSVAGNLLIMYYS